MATPRTLTFEQVRDWAAEQATTWSLDARGEDRLSVGELTAGVEARWALRIEAFNLLLPVGLAAARLSSEIGGRGLLARLRRGGRDRAARAVALAALERLGRRTSRHPARVLFVTELATPSALEPSMATARAMTPGSWRAAAADPRAFRAWAGLATAPVAVALGPVEARRRLRRAADATAERWDAIRADPPAIVLDGMDVAARALDALEPLARRSLPWLAVESLAVERVIERLAPSRVVLASDQHRIGRLVVNAARRHGARTLVLQHGLPQYDLGYVPVVADAVATWSESADEWFLARGTPGDRLMRLGNPRLDPLAGRDRTSDAAAVAADPRRAGAPRLLIALSPNDADRNRTIVELGLAAVRLLPNASLVVKLHPGAGDWAGTEDLLRAQADLAGRVSTARRELLYPLLHWADAVLLHRSTVAVEALVGGTPVLIAATAGASVTDAAPDDLALPEVSHAAELATRLAALAEPQQRKRFVEVRRSAIERTAGPLDGGSARRIAAWLESTP